MIKNIFMYLSEELRLIPVVLIFFFAFIAYLSAIIFFLFNHTLVTVVSYNFAIYVLLNSTILGLLYFSDYTYILLYYLFFILIYASLYIWRKLPFTFVSFISFLINYTMLCLFVFGLYKLFGIGFDCPIFLEDLSQLSTFRYIILFNLSLLACLVSGVIYYVPDYRSKLWFLDYITVPYMFIETKKILVTWEDSFFGKHFSIIIDSIVFSYKHRFLFYFVHFVFSYAISLLQALLFVNFTFFHGDLRYNICLLPLSLISWFYKYYYYYFSSFAEQNSLDVRSYLMVTLKDSRVSISDADIISSGRHELLFEFSEEAISRGDTSPELLTELSNLWSIMAQYTVITNFYKTKTKYFSYVILVIRLICWGYIFYFNFNEDNRDLLLLFSLITNPNLNNNLRTYATQSYRVKKSFAAALESKSKGSYRYSHPVTTDTDKEQAGNVPFDHQPTHGDGQKDNPSKPLGNTDIKGNNVPQRGSYPTEKFDFPRKWLGKSYAGSKDYYEKPEVAENNKKNQPNENKDD